MNLQPFVSPNVARLAQNAARMAHQVHLTNIVLTSTVLPQKYHGSENAVIFLTALSFQQERP